MTLLEDDPAFVEMMDEPEPYDDEADDEMPAGYDDIVQWPPPDPEDPCR